MSTKTVGLFVDVSNLFHCIGRRFPNQKLDYHKLMESAISTDTAYRATAYGIQEREAAIKFVTCLKHYGYEVKYKNPRCSVDPVTQLKTYKRSSWNVGIAMDVVRIIDKLDTVILCSSDSELSPLVDYIRERGLVCNILACGISRELKVTASNCTEITESMLVGSVDV